MARWRRLCIDITEDDRIVGASVEYYGENRFERTGVAVMGRSAWRGRSAVDLLEELVELGWPNPQLPLNYHMVGGEDD